jgi:hypothetical protein
VCPGIIDTPITRNARLRGDRLDTPAMRERLVATYQRRGYGPERVAEKILAAVARNRAIAPISIEAWLGHYLQRFTPGMVRWLNRRLGERDRRRPAEPG